MAEDAATQPVTREDVIAAAAAMLGSKTHESASLAVERGWLDQQGEPTPSGCKVVHAIAEQKGTRSVFR